MGVTVEHTLKVAKLTWALVVMESNRTIGAAILALTHSLRFAHPEPPLPVALTIPLEDVAGGIYLNNLP